MKALSIMLFLICISNAGFSQTAEDHFKIAENFCKDEKYQKAIDCYSKAIELDNNQEKYYLHRALAYQKTGMAKESFSDFCKCIELNPTSEAFVERGMLFELLGDYDNAIKDYTEALTFLESDSLRKYCLTARGYSKHILGDNEGGCQDMLEALVMDSNYIAALNDIGMTLTAMEKHEEALKYLYRVEKIDSTFTMVYSNIGYVLSNMGKYQESIKYFDKLIVLEKNNPYAYSNRSYSKLKSGDTEGAMEDVKKSIKLWPGNSYAYRNQALIYIEMKNFKNACESLAKAYQLGFDAMYGEEVNELREKYCHE